MSKELSQCQVIERSLFKTYRKRIWVPFIMAIKKYELIQEGDRIAVCISGGKDSMLLAKLLQMLQRHSDFPFELVFLVMDPGYNSINREKIESNAKLLEIPITIFETDIFNIADRTEKNPCYLCAKMRRGHLYSQAKKLGCNKIALGHHFNDVIETTLLGMFYGSQLQAMLPKLHSTNFEGMELIRPLYCVHEDDIIAWTIRVPFACDSKKHAEKRRKRRFLGGYFGYNTSFSIHFKCRSAASGGCRKRVGTERCRYAAF